MGEHKQRDVGEERAQIENDITFLNASKKRVQKQLNRIHLEIDKSMKEYKKLENDNAAIVSYNKEQQTKVEVMVKLAEEKKKAIKQLKKDQDKLIEE
jgi:chromosome segregation ATPase